MKTVQRSPADELRMSGKEFDRIMRGALQVHPEEAPKPKRAAKSKPKAVRKKAA